MKKGVFLTICGFFTLSLLSAQTSLQTSMSAPSDSTEVLVLKEPSHSFGKIPQGRPVTYVFEIVNTGKVPLLLENVQASCGCTTPEWSKAAIPPGATAPIKVGYNAYAEGNFAKTVTITYNNVQRKQLVITGEVYKLPQTSAPENASLQYLKQTNQ